MSEQKFTPGPWSYRGVQSTTIDDGVVTVDHEAAPVCWTVWRVSLDEGLRVSRPIAEAYIVGHEHAAAEANARLIAAAPDLFEEAREICAILDMYRADTGEEPCFDHEAIGEEVARRHDSLTAAIAKALGQ